MMSLDGFFDGPNQNLDWHNVDAEFNDFAVEQTGVVDVILFGRRTYQMMASFWSSPQAMADDPVVAEIMNRTPKIVFSKTLDRAEWNNTRLVKSNIAEEITKLKQLPGRELAIFGSADLLSSLMQMNLVDEHRVMVNPVLLGGGTPLFKPMERQRLRLLKTRQFKNGNVLLYYRPDGK